jgi:hypothetical protein
MDGSHELGCILAFESTLAIILKYYFDEPFQLGGNQEEIYGESPKNPRGFLHTLQNGLQFFPVPVNFVDLTAYIKDTKFYIRMVFFQILDVMQSNAVLAFGTAADNGYFQVKTPSFTY